jgi:predicted kinase
MRRLEEREGGVSEGCEVVQTASRVRPSKRERANLCKETTSATTMGKELKAKREVRHKRLNARLNT